MVGHFIFKLPTSKYLINWFEDSLVALKGQSHIVIITELTVWHQAVELSVSPCLLSVSPESWISDRKWTKDAASLFFISLRGVAFVCATVGWLKLGIDQSSSMRQPHHILCFGINRLCCQERGTIFDAALFVFWAPNIVNMHLVLSRGFKGPAKHKAGAGLTVWLPYLCSFGRYVGWLQPSWVYM